MSEGSETFTFHGLIEETGKVLPDNRNAVRGRLARWKGRRVTVRVKRYVKPKSNPQLEIFHGPIVEAFMDYCGSDDDEEVKGWIKTAWGLWEKKPNLLTGEEENKLKSLADYTSEEMSTFIDRVLREGAMREIIFDLDRSSARI